MGEFPHLLHETLRIGSSQTVKPPPPHLGCMLHKHRWNTAVIKPTRTKTKEIVEYIAKIQKCDCCGLTRPCVECSADVCTPSSCEHALPCTVAPLRCAHMACKDCRCFPVRRNGLRILGCKCHWETLLFKNCGESPLLDPFQKST